MWSSPLRIPITSKHTVEWITNNWLLDILLGYPHDEQSNHAIIPKDETTQSNQSNQQLCCARNALLSGMPSRGGSCRSLERRAMAIMDAALSHGVTPRHCSLAMGGIFIKGPELTYPNCCGHIRMTSCFQYNVNDSIRWTEWYTSFLRYTL